jgi:hypothetical protein
MVGYQKIWLILRAVTIIRLREARADLRRGRQVDLGFFDVALD